MKKLFVLLIIALSLSANAFAVTTPAASGTSDGDAQTMYGDTPANLDLAKASKGVYFGWNTSETGYSINASHNAGTKVYGTAYDSTALYFSNVEVGADLAEPTDSSAAVAFEGWEKI